MRPPDRALLLRSEHGWSLPLVEVDTFSDDDFGPARRAFEELLGTPVAILRYADRDVDREQRMLEVVDVLERLDVDWKAPPGMAWVDRRSLSALPFANDEHREIVLRSLDELERGAVPPERAPWAREGWLAEATAWIDDSLTALRRSRTGPVEQVRAWCLSSVLRVPTTGGTVFFKATAGSPLFVDEGHVMRGLSRLFQKNVPRPLAVDTRRRWMLLDDLGPEIGWNAPFEVRELVHRLFAVMQVMSAQHIEVLFAIGCVDRRPAWLARQAGKLIEDDASVAGLENTEIARLRSLELPLRALCNRLADGPVPDTLVHGDLHLSNVAKRDGEYLFFDWTDACVTHPFLDMIDIGHEDATVRDALRDAYLSVWSEFASHEMLLELWALAEPLASLNQAVSYRLILTNVEHGAAQELEWALPYWLRKVLEADVEALLL